MSKAHYSSVQPSQTIINSLNTNRYKAINKSRIKRRIFSSLLMITIYRENALSVILILFYWRNDWHLALTTLHLSFKLVSKLLKCVMKKSRTSQLLVFRPTFYCWSWSCKHLEACGPGVPWPCYYGCSLGHVIEHVGLACLLQWKFCRSSTCWKNERLNMLSGKRLFYLNLASMNTLFL